METVLSEVAAPPTWRLLEVLSSEVAAPPQVWRLLEAMVSSVPAPSAWVELGRLGGQLKSPAVGFSISLSPSTAEVVQGGSVSTTIYVAKLYPWYGRGVSLSVQNLPPGATFTLSVSGAAPNYSSTLTIFTGSQTPLGIYLTMVLATDGLATVTRTLQLEVKSPTPPPPPPPPKYPPASRVKPVSPVWWSSLPVQVEAEATDNDGTVVAVRLYYRYSLDNSSWSAWKLYGEDNQAPWSWSFSPVENEGYYELYSIGVDNDGLVENAPAVPDAALGVDLTPPAAPAPISPVGDSLASTKVRLSWSEVSDLSGVPTYEVQVDRSSDFSSPFLQLSAPGTSLEFECPVEGRVFWRVRSVNGVGLRSAWSEPAGFACVRVKPMEKTLTYLPAFQPAEFDLTPMEPLFIRRVTLTPSSPLTQATVYLVEFENEEFCERFAWLSPPEYRYAAWLFLDTPSASVQRTEVEFQIFRSWLRERDLDEKTVVLRRLYRGRWENVPATLVDSDEEKFYYVASFTGFYDLLSATASKRPPAPPPPPAPPAPPYLLYALLTMLGVAGVGFAYFFYQRRLVIRPAIPVEKVARPALPPAIRPTIPPAVPLEKLGPKPELKVLPMPAKPVPLEVRKVLPKVVPMEKLLESIRRAALRPAVPLEKMARVVRPPVPPAVELRKLAVQLGKPVPEVVRVPPKEVPVREVLESMKKVALRPAVSLEKMARVVRPPVPPAVELEKLAKEVKPLRVEEVRREIQEPVEILKKLKEASGRQAKSL
jgi:hypothetical protein